MSKYYIFEVGVIFEEEKIDKNDVKETFQTFLDYGDDNEIKTSEVISVKEAKCQFVEIKQ